MILGTVAYLVPRAGRHRGRRRPQRRLRGRACWPTSCSPARRRTPATPRSRWPTGTSHDDVPGPVGRARRRPARARRPDRAAPPAATRPPARPTPAAFLAALCRGRRPRCRIAPPGRRCPGAAAEAATHGQPPPPTPQRLPARPGRGGTRALPRRGRLARRPRDPARAGPRPRPAPPAQPPGVRRRGSRSSRCSGCSSARPAWWLGNGRWTAVPRSRGRADGRRAAALAADLVATVTRRPPTTGGRRAGVTAMDPTPGARLLRGSTVRLTVSAAAAGARRRRGHRRSATRGAGRPRRRAHAQPVGRPRVQRDGPGGQPWCAPTRPRARPCRAAAA